MPKTSESDRPPPKAIPSILNLVVVLQKCHDFVVGSYSRVILKAIPLRYPSGHPKSWAKALAQVEGSLGFGFLIRAARAPAPRKGALSLFSLESIGPKERKRV